MDIIEAELELTKPEAKTYDESISDECFLAKLALALTIPSFCSKYIYEKDVYKKYKYKERERYPQWCDEYLDFPLLTSKECYAARCSLLHNGDDDLEAQPVLDNEIKASQYKLSVPYSDDTLCLVKIGDDDKNEKSFCSNALIVKLVDAYIKFKAEYPNFVYPLQKNN